MSTNSIDNILRTHRRDLAFIVGNGINLYGNGTISHSWHELLITLWQQHTDRAKETIPEGIALTEFYDVLDIKGGSDRSSQLQKEFCDLMKDWLPQPHPKAFVAWAKKHNTPILTTNFETTLARCCEAKLFQMDAASFTDFYPWGSYYGVGQIKDPLMSFAIWHINGMQKYPRSVRLGLTHYMGSVERARGWIHAGAGDDSRLFSGKNRNRWAGHRTWLHIVFNKPLLIFGLALEPSEMFLRWLLIERAKYFQMFPDRRQPAWYVSTETQLGQKLFLAGVGITAVPVQTYADIYETPWIRDAHPLS
ncbi:MAG: hypothetical protein QOK48_2023 [Blastocatellia bacterium]|jgi:hypothetical protein|nr:hypothetical protein [Blastocatellia bacterium]